MMSYMWRFHLIHSIHFQSVLVLQTGPIHIKKQHLGCRCLFRGSCCSFSALHRCTERIAAVQIPFFVCEEDNLQLGNRAFYVPPSPVIGCHWSCVRGGKRLHGSFPDFPGRFPTPPSSPPPNRTPTLHGVQSRHASSPLP